MKEKVGKFLSTNSLSIPIYTSLACIGVWDSITALIVYTVIMHILLLLFIIALYYPIIAKSPITGSLIRKIMFMTIYTSITIVILVITKHWYVLCVSMLTIFLGFVHLYDLTKGESTK